jgi:uncharacterized protein (TIGR02452 family)
MHTLNDIVAVARRPNRFGATVIETRNESTFAAAARLAGPDRHVAVLNFASARNPGGGFLRGTSAQEEALSYASGLYPCLAQVPEYYAHNRANGSALYLDLVIFSPRVPFFRDDWHNLLAAPVLASVITAPAPNRRAVAEHEAASLRLVEPVLRRRAELVLAVAKGHEVDRLVLGAWGCGVFGNDPDLVARIFAELLRGGGPYDGAFEQVVFAIPARSPDDRNHRAFAAVLG